MNRNKEIEKKRNAQNKPYYKGKGGANKPRNKGKDQCDREPEEGTALNPKGRDNNPNWYFLDAKVADQVSQLSFQELGDMPLHLRSASANPTTGVVTSADRVVSTLSTISVLMNPAPGVQLKSVVGQTKSLQKSAINLAGFRLFTKLSAFTGRKQDYAPQDVSTLILFMGELISCTEWCRRAFGVSFTTNMRNRAFPLKVFRTMGIDPDDMFTNYSSYRTQFNKIVTRLNQIPIPSNIAYFDKCASLYEKIYMDSDSPMAQLIIFNPHTTWHLDESKSNKGTVLATSSWCGGVTGSHLSDPQHMQYYLDKLDQMVDELMSSSTFNLIYTDLMNLATKMSVPFWKFDYLLDGYIMYPEYNENALLMLHNATIAHTPNYSQDLTEQIGLTPFNDVWPDVEGNALYYNPAIPWVGTDEEGSFPAIPHYEMVVDSPTPDVKVEDRIEMLKYAALAGNVFNDTVHSKLYSMDCVLSDHYITDIVLYDANEGVFDVQSTYFSGNLVPFTLFELTQMDWAPRLTMKYKDTNGVAATGFTLGDLNYYTTVDLSYLRKVVDFTGLALYDLR